MEDGSSVEVGVIGKEKGVIGYSRGRVFILDREGLESTSCECYKTVKQSFDSYLSAVKPQPTHQVALRAKQCAGLGDGVSGKIRIDLPAYNNRNGKAVSGSLIGRYQTKNQR